MIAADMQAEAARLTAMVGGEPVAFLRDAWSLMAHLVMGAFNIRTLPVFGLCGLVAVVHFARRGGRFVIPAKIVKGTLATLAIFAANVALAPIVIAAAKGLQAGYDALHIPQIDAAVWSGLPKWALAVIAVFAYDVANYWNHRAMHMRWLWPVHAVHHSDPALTAVSTFRIHALEALVMMGSYTLLLSWLGFPPDVLGAAAVLLGLHNAYTHINVDWGHGPLRHVIASPRFHRWHHADAPEAHGKNLANVFPFLDVIFGTYHTPGRCDLPVGAQGVPENDVARLLLFPFASWAERIHAAPGRSRAPDAERADGADLAGLGAVEIKTTA